MQGNPREKEERPGRKEYGGTRFLCKKVLRTRRPCISRHGGLVGVGFKPARTQDACWPHAQWAPRRPSGTRFFWCSAHGDHASPGIGECRRLSALRCLLAPPRVGPTHPAKTLTLLAVNYAGMQKWVGRPVAAVIFRPNKWLRSQNRGGMPQCVSRRVLPSSGSGRPPCRSIWNVPQTRTLKGESRADFTPHFDRISGNSSRLRLMNSARFSSTRRVQQQHAEHSLAR